MRPDVIQAGIADIEQVAPLFDAYRQFYGAESDLVAAEGYLRERIERGESVVLIALHGADVVGFAQLYPSFSSVSMCPIVILNDLYVVAEARARGVGRKLCVAAIEYAAQIGAGSITLATQHANVRAMALYESLGFVRDREFTYMSLRLT